MFPFQQIGTMRRIIFIFVLFLFTIESIADDAATIQHAEEAFRKGTEAFNAMDYEGASRAFRRAYELRPTWKLFYNIGQSEAAAKNHGRALEAFEAYLSQGGDDVPSERRTQVVAEIDNLREMVGMVEIDAPDGASVSINDVKRGETPLLGPIPVAASVAHTVVISYEGARYERRVKVMGQQTLKVRYVPKTTVDSASTSVAVENIEQDETDPETETDDPESQSTLSPVKQWGIVTLGVGIGTLAAGAATGITALVKDKRLKEKCTPSCTSDEAQETLDTVDKLALSTNILLPVGVVVSVAGVLMVTVFAKRADKKKPPDVVLVPYMNSGTGGGILMWSF
jgi:hypothetical protein